MQILKTQKSQLDSFRNKSALSRRPLVKKKDHSDFDFSLEEFLKEETREWDEYPILLPRHGRFWDNGYEDVE